MVDAALLAGIAVAMAVGLAAVHVWLLRRGPGAAPGGGAVAAALDGDRLAGPPSVTRRPGEDGIVPTVVVDLAVDTPPREELVYETVARALGALASARDRPGGEIDHYAVELRFGPGGRGGPRPCRRVAVTRPTVRRLERGDLDAASLRAAVEAGDDGGGSPPVAWGACGDGRPQR